MYLFVNALTMDSLCALVDASALKTERGMLMFIFFSTELLTVVPTGSDDVVSPTLDELFFAEPMIKDFAII